MSIIVKSLSVGNGDMFYIRHGSDNFTIIDCCMPEDERDAIIAEVQDAASGKGIVRFISTHPDQDHICGLADLHSNINIRNFYCVRNQATKEDDTTDFEQYCALRDSDRAYYLSQGCSRRWMNLDDDERKNSGIHILWPATNNSHYLAALEDARNGHCPNNISIIMRYSLNGGVTMMWMGDLETAFMDEIKDDIVLSHAHILFAPHHGRSSGRVPTDWLDEIKPKLIIIGEAPSHHLHYYDGYNTITQNSAGDIAFECEDDKTHIYVSNSTYSVDFLEDEGLASTHGKYLGTLITK